VTLDLYSDEGYGCRALAGGFCTDEVHAGAHTFTATAADGSGRSTSRVIDIPEGGSFTWTITEN